MKNKVTTNNPEKNHGPDGKEGEHHEQSVVVPGNAGDNDKNMKHERGIFRYMVPKIIQNTSNLYFNLECV